MSHPATHGGRADPYVDTSGNNDTADVSSIPLPLPVMPSTSRSISSVIANPSTQAPLSSSTSLAPHMEQETASLGLPSLAPSRVESVQGRISPIAHVHHARAGMPAPFKRPSQSATMQAVPMRPPPPRPSTMNPPPPPAPPPPEVRAAAKLGFSASELGALVQGRKDEVSATGHVPRDHSVLIVPGVDGSVAMWDAEGEFLKLVRRITINERKLMRRRLAIVGRKNDLRAQLPLYHAAQDEFARFFQAALKDIWVSNIPTDRKTQLEKAWVKIEKLSKTVDRWQQLLEHEEDDELLKLEGKCLADQMKLMKLLGDFPPHNAADVEAQNTDIVTETTKQGEASRPPSISSLSSEDLNPTRLRYLEAVGTMNLLRDRMFNLQSEVRVQIRQRDQALNAGREVQQSSEDFYGQIHTRRQHLINEYWTTKEQMDETFQDCIAEGLDVMPAYLPADTDQLFSNQDDGFIASERPQDPYHLSESALNIAQWSRHVARMSSPGAFHLAAEFMTDKEAEEMLPFPKYAHEQVSTGMDEPSIPASGSRSPRHPSGAIFTDDIPTASRRYSAPMILESTDHDTDRVILDYQTFKTRKLNARRRQHRPISRRANTEI